MKFLGTAVPLAMQGGLVGAAILWRREIVAIDPVGLGWP